MSRGLVNLILGFALVATALSLVYVRHESRVLFRDYAQLLNVRDQLKVEWGRLQLEQATLAENSRIEQIARQRLDMKRPDPAQIVVIAK